MLAVLGPLFSPATGRTTILTQTFLFGIAAASLIFLSAYGGMVSLAQTALMGIAGVRLGNLVTKGGPGGESKGLTSAGTRRWRSCSRSSMTTAIGLMFGAIAARSVGIYFLMLTLTFSRDHELLLRPGDKLGRASRRSAGINRYTPGWIGDIVGHPNRLYYIALVAPCSSTSLIRYVVRTPFGITLQGVRDEPVRMASLGYNVPLHRTLAFGFAAFLASLARRPLRLVERPDRAPATSTSPQTINLLVIAVIGGLGADRRRVARRVRVHHHPELRSRLHSSRSSEFGGTLFGG